MDRLAEIESRANAASPGPWHECRGESGGCKCGFVWTTPHDSIVCAVNGENWSGHFDCDTYPSKEGQHADADFIAHAREDIPWLIAEVRRLRKDLAASARTAKAFAWPSEEEIRNTIEDVADDYISVEPALEDFAIRIGLLAHSPDARA